MMLESPAVDCVSRGHFFDIIKSTLGRVHMHRQILVVEDDPQIGRLLSTQLRELGHEVAWQTDGASGLKRFQEGVFALVILDLILPEMDGLNVCTQIRMKDRVTPILMLTARAEKQDVVRGLELGADDYVTKPFSTAELVARINALLRRMDIQMQMPDPDNVLQRGALSVYPDQRMAVLNGQRMALTSKEFDVLLLFARHPGRAFSRTELLNAVWGLEFEGYDHTVNTHINRLRGKLKLAHPSASGFIQTVWGVGYRFARMDELETILT